MQKLYEHLCRYDAADWVRTVDTLAVNIADVDREATRIWFAFFPLNLQVALNAAEDKQATERKLGLMGRWGLLDKIDTSHRFLYAHRYWPQIKAAIAATEQMPADLGALMTQVAEAAVRTERVERAQLLGMAAVGLMTLRQVGVEAFAAAPGQVHLSPAQRAMSAKQVMKTRAKDDWQGLLGSLRGAKKIWTVRFDENNQAATYTAIQSQDLASAAQSDKREYRSADPRCIPNEGPIPVECRAASCGTCWVGIIGGAEKLSPVEPHEAARMKVFGYADLKVGTRPVIRLACQAKSFGAVSIVIPPWNGIISRL